jgi:hypothetical protein
MHVADLSYIRAAIPGGHGGNGTISLSLALRQCHSTIISGAKQLLDPNAVGRERYGPQSDVRVFCDDTKLIREPSHDVTVRTVEPRMES